MTTTWNFILAGAVTLASAAGIVAGEAAKGELRLAEAATTVNNASPDVFCLAEPQHGLGGLVSVVRHRAGPTPAHEAGDVVATDGAWL